MLLALLLLIQNPVTVRVNHDQFDPGDHARVYVQSAQDGYLVVLHADLAGRIRVLFPLDPTEDDFIRGGKKFEVRGRGDREAFQIEGTDGSGTVLAAVSPDAFNFQDFVRNDHWDFRALGGPSDSVRDDPLARLLDIVQHASGDSAGRFDYDYATYVVNSRDIAARYRDHSGYYPQYGFYYNPFYNPFCADAFYGWSASCYAFGYGFGYRGYGYGFGFGFPVYRPYRPYRPYIFASIPGPRFAQPRLVIPANRPSRYIPVQPRSRSDVGSEFSNPRRGESRPRDMAKPNIAPRPNSAGPSRAQPQSQPRSQPRVFSGGRSAGGGSRGSSGGGGRPAPRSGGGGGGGGGRRH